MKTEVAIAAAIATLRDPKRLEATGITDENNNIPMGIIAELIPIISVETPRDSNISESKG